MLTITVINYIVHCNDSEPYHGHTMTHSAGLFELAQNRSSAGWTAGDLASTLSVKTVTMKGAALRRGGGRGSGSARSRTGGSEMGEWDTEERDGWCADSMRYTWLTDSRPASQIFLIHTPCLINVSYSCYHPTLLM